MWCPLRGLFYARCAHPPNRPKTPTRERASSARGRAGVLLRRIPSPAAHSLNSPAPALRGRAVSAAYGRGISCAVSAPSRSRPHRGLLRAAFAGCLCAELLLLALPLPPRPNIAGYFQQPAILWPWREGGASKRGAPTPCPRRPAPPNPLRAAFALPARCSCAPSALRLRGCLSLLASAAIMPPDGRLGGSPEAPAPSVRAL